MNKFIKKIKNPTIFLFSLLLMYLIYRNGKYWQTHNCDGAIHASSCIYSFERIYFLPIIGFIFFYMIIFWKKILYFIKKADSKLDSLSSRKSFLLCSLLVASVMSILFYSKFSFIPLNPENTQWLLSGDDWNQNYMGWFVFRHTPWLFPFGLIDQLNYPIGTSLGYTDSIPFLAFIFKLLKDVLPENFQYFGPWLFSCYVLQAVFASLLVKNWECKFLIKVMASILIAASPVLFFRFGHITLNCHWMILASFCIYFSESLKEKNKIFFQSCLLGLSAWIHPYITLMLGFFYIAVLFHAYLSKQVKWKWILAILCSSLLFIFASWYLIGYFYIKGFYGTERIASYSSNLNSLFNPLQGSSFFLKPLPTEGTQYEGFAYLGVGLLILFFVVCFENWVGKKVIFVKKNVPFLIAIACLTLLALSNSIHFGRTIVLSISLPENIENRLATFRAIGRFIWPFWYFLVLSILYFWLLFFLYSF